MSSVVLLLTAFKYYVYLSSLHLILLVPHQSSSGIKLHVLLLYKEQILKENNGWIYEKNYSLITGKERMLPTMYETRPEED
jgi:hypothetical protein